MASRSTRLVSVEATSLPNSKAVRDLNSTEIKKKENQRKHPEKQHRRRRAGPSSCHSFNPSAHPQVRWLPLTWSVSVWTPGDWADGTSCWTAATAPLGIRMSWEARGTFRPRVRFTCNRFPSCGWREEEEEEQRKENKRKSRQTEEMEGKDHKTK